MKKFEFSKCKQCPDSVFSGEMFYNVYKDAQFLQHSSHIEKILYRGYELRKMLKDVEPGEKVMVTGVQLANNLPLIVTKTGPSITVKNYDFTANRLTGFVAAYAFDNRHLFPNMKSSEAEILGLAWNNNDTNKCRLYLSAVSGTEHFYNQFLYLPLVCALRKFHLKKITLEPVIKMTRIKNKHGARMGEILKRNFSTVSNIWRQFPGESDENDLSVIFHNLPAELKKVLTTAT